jgi:hypothetical protein
MRITEVLSNQAIEIFTDCLYDSPNYPELNGLLGISDKVEGEIDPIQRMVSNEIDELTKKDSRV